MGHGVRSVLARNEPPNTSVCCGGHRAFLRLESSLVFAGLRALAVRYPRIQSRYSPYTAPLYVSLKNAPN